MYSGDTTRERDGQALKDVEVLHRRSRSFNLKCSGDELTTNILGSGAMIWQKSIPAVATSSLQTFCYMVWEVHPCWNRHQLVRIHGRRRVDGQLWLLSAWRGSCSVRTRGGSASQKCPLLLRLTCMPLYSAIAWLGFLWNTKVLHCWSRSGEEPAWDFMKRLFCLYAKGLVPLLFFMVQAKKMSLVGCDSVNVPLPLRPQLQGIHLWLLLARTLLCELHSGGPQWIDTDRSQQRS